MQVTCGFVFGSACVLGILWQLDLKTEVFLMESLLSLFKRDSSIHISCLEMLSLWLCGMNTMFRCPSWQNSNKNNTFDFLSLKTRTGCSGNDEQSVPTLRHSIEVTAGCSDCWSVWRRWATSQGLLLTPLPPVEVKSCFCQCSRPQDC